MEHLLNWKVGFCENYGEEPNKYFAAAVPGAVQLDYAKEYGLPDYNRGLNFRQYKPLEDLFWIYKTEYDASNLSGDKKLFLILNGVDYSYEVYANGERLCGYEGMYKRQRIELTRFAGKNIEIKVILQPVPKSALPGVHKDTRDEANQCCKPAVSYGWDFHPRLVPLGIWEDAYILETVCSSVPQPRFSYKLSHDLKTADIMLESGGLPETDWEFCSPDGSVIFTGSGEKCKFTLDDPELWWCSGYGEQPLYSYTATVGDITVTKKIGIKRIELVKAEGSWGEGLNYPMTRNTPPITVRLNNTVIFAKGSNWVCPEIFYGKLNYERYLSQLTLVKNANLNFLRCWGGAVINKESFFELCDELGIMVWQEFPLACNRYEGTDSYISVLKEEAAAIIDNIKEHVCLMLWCGGNELFNNWSCMTEQDRAIRLMDKLTFEKTPEIPFLPTSPVMGMAHGPYSFNMVDGSEVIGVIQKSRNTGYTEFGGGGFSTKDTLLRIGDISELEPFDLNNEIVREHGTHALSPKIEYYFGKITDTGKLIECGQFMQTVVQQFIFEEARRQKPYCSIVSNWCFNEPWPNTGNNSLVCWPDNIKPAYYAVAKACRKVLASARYRKFVYYAGETIDFDIFLLNDSLSKLADGKIDIYIQIGEGQKTKLMSWEYKDVPICKNAVGPTVRYGLPFAEDADTLQIILEAGEYSSKYTLLYRLPEKPANAPKKMNAILDENC